MRTPILTFTFFRFLTCGLLAGVSAAWAQDPGAAPAQPVPVQQGAERPDPGTPGGKPFSLEFPGGGVHEFVAAVEEATKAPFNLIVPASAQTLKLPPVRVREVLLPPLLEALSVSSLERKTVSRPAQPPGPVFRAQGGIEYVDTQFRFTQTPNAAGAPVWMLSVTAAPEMAAADATPPRVRFYQLKPHLNAGLKVEDITTVAETAWKMMKLDPAKVPEIKIHEETGLMIAVGSETALEVIDSALNNLPIVTDAAQPQFKGQQPVPMPPTVPRPGTPGK